MKNFKRILALVLAVMMVASVATVFASADDLVTATANAAPAYNETSIARLNKLGIFKGSTSGDMHADDDVTREQMALFVGRVMTGKTATNYWESYVNDTTFKDIDKEAAEYVGAIAYAFENGVVNGKSEVRFDPQGKVLYQEALAMAVRSLGYTGLSYPNGVINKAIKLGLTKDIKNVAYTDAAARGVIATILYNALYAENSLFAKNFNLKTGTFMLVATPAVTMPSGLRLPAAMIEGFEGITYNDGFVAFAPVVNNRADNTTRYEYVKTSQLSDDIAADYCNKLGYVYTLTYENDIVAWADECYTEKFVNYGDDAQITRTIGLNTAGEEKPFLTFGGKNYCLSDRKDPSFAWYTGTQDLVLYTNPTAGYVDVYKYEFKYDINGNIVNEENEIVLWVQNGAYYKNVEGVLVKATAEEVHDAMIACGKKVYSGYDILTDDDAVETIARNNFCEIVAMDYDGDGEFDGAMYTPYRLGRTNDIYNTDKFMESMGINDDNGLKGSGTNKTKDYKITGATESLASWTYYLFTYNKFNHEINVIEVLAEQSGNKVTWATKGALNTSSLIYDNSKVKIGAKEFKIGGWNADDLTGAHIVLSRAGAGTISTADFENGWNDIFYRAMEPQYVGFTYIVLAGHVIWGYPTTKAAETNYNFVTFDPWVSTYALNNDMIVVDALTDASGVYKPVTIKSVDTEEFTNIELEAFYDYIDATYAENASLVKYSYFFNETLKNLIEKTAAFQLILRKNIIEHLCAITPVGMIAQEMVDANAPLFYSVFGTTTDGAYALRTLTEGEIANAYATKNTGTVTFTLGVSSKALATNAVENKVVKTSIATTKDTVFTFVCQDGIYTYVGQPKDEYAINLDNVQCLYCANAAQIMIIARTAKVDSVALGDASWTGAVHGLNGELVERVHVNTWAFTEYVPYIPKAFLYDEVYLVTGKSQMVEAYPDGEGGKLYFYTNLYDLINGKYVESVESRVELPVYGDNAYINYGLIIARDADQEEENYDIFNIPEYFEKNGSLFNLEDAGVKFEYGKFVSFDKDNTGAYAHVKIGETTYTVRSVNVITVYATGKVSALSGMKEIEVGDFANVKAGAAMYYNYDATTGALTGYAFNALAN